MKIAICDSDGEYRRQLYNQCAYYCSIREYKADIREYASLEELCAEKDAPDCLFLDVGMVEADETGAKYRLRKLQAHTYIVCMACDNRYMERAFGKNVIDYIIKPSTQARIDRTLTKFLNEYDSDVTDFTIDIVVNRKHILLDVSEILYITSDRVYSVVYTDHGHRSFRKTLDEWERRLQKYDFLRIHRSYIVNLHHVASVKDKVMLTEGIELPIGRTKLTNVSEKYCNYVGKRLL